MDLLDRLDAEHAAVVRLMPALGMSDIAAARASMATKLAALRGPLPIPGDTSSEDIAITGTEAGARLLLRIYRPRTLVRSCGGLLWIHGGGYVMGSVEASDPFCRQLASDVGCVVVAVEYRLAPEHPFPAGIEDCYSALAWMSRNTDRLGIDPSRIAIGGASAGSGLAAGLALLTRDRAEFKVCFQLLIYPMIDDRNITASSIAITHPQVWNRNTNIACWAAYLGKGVAQDMLPYAAPSRAGDLSGLPPAYVAVGEHDLFRDEDIEYAGRLLVAGVATELHVYPGAFHGSDLIVPNAAVSLRFARDRVRALVDVLGRQAAKASVVQGKELIR